jgi:hypothetical protein
MNSKERHTRSEIEAIPAPEYTKTWHPISHKEVLDSLDLIVQAEGVGVVNESYSTRNAGRNMFGTWTLDIPLGDGGSLVQLGFRNSLMKTFAVGVAAGTHVIACSNMQFSGQFLEFRKHTSGLTFEELLYVADAAFGKALDQAKELHEWHEGLRAIPLPEPQMKALTFDAMDRGILPANRFGAFREMHRAEVELAGDDGLYPWHGALTRINRDLNLFSVGRRTADLRVLCDEYASQVAA